MNEWVNELVNEWVSEWVNELMNEWMNGILTPKHHSLQAWSKVGVYERADVVMLLDVFQRCHAV